MCFYFRVINGAVMRKNSLKIIFIVGMVLSAMGCSKKNVDHHLIAIPDEAASMLVSFTWDGIKSCTHDSPEIRVSQIPDGTVTLQVQLKDLTLLPYNGGGGEVDNDGSGIIPAGALTSGYNGPCPRPGERHQYEFWVMAKNADGKIIGFGKARRRFPPKQ